MAKETTRACSERAPRDEPLPTPDSRRQTRQTPVHWKSSLLLALPFLIGGTALMLVASDVIVVAEERIHAPRWVLSMIGQIFTIAGLLLVAYTWRAASRRKRLDDAKRLFPGEPWMADHEWDREAAIASGEPALANSAFGLIFMAVFLAPFNWLAFASGACSIMLWLIVGMFDLIILALFADVVHKAAQQLKYGTSRLRFASFPFFLGETLDVSFSNPRGIGRYDALACTLRCIQVRDEVRGSGRNRRRVAIPHEVYKDEQIIDGPGEYRGSDADLRIRFDLPKENWETKLAEHPPRYWSLQIKASTPGVDFDADFLVPVYARP